MNEQTPNTLEYHPTTEAEKELICQWQYPGDYAIYNSTPYEEQKRKNRGFANPKNRLYSFCDGSRLVGYINLFEEETAVFFGIGVDPACCGQGYGQAMAREARCLSHRLYPGKTVYLEVRTWNQRAVRCYEKAGFSIVGQPIRQTTSIGEGTFFRMEESESLS